MAGLAGTEQRYANASGRPTARRGASRLPRMGGRGTSPTRGVVNLRPARRGPRRVVR